MTEKGQKRRSTTDRTHTAQHSTYLEMAMMPSTQPGSLEHPARAFLAIAGPLYSMKANELSLLISTNTTSPNLEKSSCSVSIEVFLGKFSWR